jgi:hypothetical protein
MKTALVMFALAFASMTSPAFAGGQYGKSGVFITTSTDAGAFTSRGATEVGFIGLGGGQANSPTGKVAVSSVTEQYGASHGGSSNVLTAVDTAAIALQDRSSSSASASSNTATSSSVKNGTAVTNAGAAVSAVANNWHNHIHH